MESEDLQVSVLKFNVTQQNNGRRDSPLACKMPKSMLSAYMDLPFKVTVSVVLGIGQLVY
jgi:hypothetical protein